MVPEERRNILKEWFEPAPEGHPLLPALRADLKDAFPELDADRILNAVRDQVEKVKPTEDRSNSSALHLRAESSEPAPRSECIKIEPRTDGWFAAEVFKIARVHEEVRRLGTLVATRPDPRYCYPFNKTVLKTIQGTAEVVEDLIYHSFKHVLEKATQYDCGQGFFPWYKTILTHLVIDEIRVKQLPITSGRDPDESTSPDLSGRMSRWIDTLVEGNQQYNIVYERETFLTAARLELEAIGIKDPPRSVVERTVRLAERSYRERTKREGAEPDSDKVPYALAQLHVAYGNHCDFRKELAAVDRDGQIENGIVALIMYQEATKRERTAWRGDDYAGPVDQLARIQVLSWGLLNPDSEETDVCWMAARNVHWFSWLLKMAAFLASCLRHAENQADPELDELVESLRPLDCLNTFPASLRKSLEPFCPSDDQLTKLRPGDLESSRLLMLIALSRTGMMSSHKAAVKIDAAFPEADWFWWKSRATGRDQNRADEVVRNLAALIPKTPDRSRS